MADVIKFLTVEKALRSTWMTAFNDHMDYINFINRQMKDWPDEDEKIK